ncbi:hypothetical protein CVT25_001969 [Psilocybe cyanescens]|uniref:Ras-domain-containing protein n=1 Tax=Psilocybe cyanescens TaxID=93625 RepID=A0A409WQQ0_PSICY|nr:hypothetical protein CVT25_001969 [Psilocybe cyanescens]
MPNDFNTDATELLETYGSWLFTVSAMGKLEQGNRVYCITSRTTLVRPLENPYLIRQSQCLIVKDHSQHTIGVEFSSRTVKLGEKRIKLQLWDTAGQERFRSVTRSYYRGAAGAILVYDITNRDSFLNLSRWLADARTLASPNLVVVLVGNKSDREEDREVEWAEASRWAAENGAYSRELLFFDSRLSYYTVLEDVHFLEASSLTGENVEAPFLLAARAILLSIESGTLDPEKAGSGVSYGDRALRRVNSSSRLSFGSLSGARRRGAVKLKVKNWIPGSKCC